MSANLIPFILFQSFTTVVCGVFYKYIIAQNDLIISQDEKIKYITSKLINMESHISSLNENIYDLENKIDSQIERHEDLIKSQIDINHQLNEYVNYTYDLVE